MTRTEFWEMRKRNERLTARSKTIVADLRVDGADPVSLEAAEIIEWLLDSKARLQKDFDNEIREGQRSARDAYAEGQQAQYDRDHKRF